MRLANFDWATIGRLLHATFSTRLRGWPEAIALNWPERQFVMHENGGEYNVTCREADGSVWELGFSIPYTRWGMAIGPATFAYRVRCAIESKQIDYEVNLESWGGNPGLSHVARVLVVREIADHLDRCGAAGLHRARFESERLFQAGSPSQSLFCDILERLGLPAEEINDRVRQVVLRGLDHAVQAAQRIEHGHHVAMVCECTSPTRDRVCIVCQFKRGPLPEESTSPSA
jgi:hypothetical protein